MSVYAYKHMCVSPHECAAQASTMGMHCASAPFPQFLWLTLLLYWHSLLLDWVYQLKGGCLLLVGPFGKLRVLHIRDPIPPEHIVNQYSAVCLLGSEQEEDLVAHGEAHLCEAEASQAQLCRCTAQRCPAKSL